MNNWSIYLLPFLSAFTGWLIIRIAIKLLLQRTFPARKQQIATSLGALAAKEFNIEELAARIKDPQQLQALKPHIEGHVDHYLKHKLTEKLPVISMFVGAGTLDKIKEGLLEEIDVLLPDIIGRYTDNMKQQINIEAIVAGKINQLSATDLEVLLHKGKGLRSLFILGTVIGFLMGLVQVLLLLL